MFYDGPLCGYSSDRFTDEGFAIFRRECHVDTEAVRADNLAGIVREEIGDHDNLMGVALNVNDAVTGAERVVRSTDFIEGGGYLLVVLGMLMWKQIPVADRSVEHGHGRTAKRMLKAAEIVGGIGFPHAVQVLRLTRTVTDRKTGNRHTETV